MKIVKVHPYPMKKPIMVTLHAFPKKAILEGIKTNRKYLREKPEDYKGIKLCCYPKKNLWWIYYNSEDLTGDFKTKKEAIAWFTGGGR